MNVKPQPPGRHLVQIHTLPKGTCFGAEGKWWLITDKTENGQILCVDINSGKTWWVYEVATVVPEYAGFILQETK